MHQRSGNVSVIPCKQEAIGKQKKQTFIQDPEQNATKVKLCFAKQVCCKVLVLVSCEVFKSPLKSRGLESDAVLSRYKVGLGLKV